MVKSTRPHYYLLFQFFILFAKRYQHYNLKPLYYTHIKHLIFSNPISSFYTNLCSNTPLIYTHSHVSKKERPILSNVQAVFAQNRQKKGSGIYCNFYSVADLWKVRILLIKQL